MKVMTHAFGRRTVITGVCSAVFTLIAGCGGGSDDAPAPPQPPSPMVSLTGTVMVDQAVRNAVVCMDLNNNATCDADEPVSAPTGADGAYSLTYDSSKLTAAQVAAASLIAPMVPGQATAATTMIDAADPSAGVTETLYVLRQVPGKAGQINPLTTIVVGGISTGMTEAVARTNLAAQLGIAVTKIDNYQDDPVSAWPLPDNARTLAKVTAAALEDGAPVRTADQGAAVAQAAGDLASLTYTDTSNYFYRTIDIEAKAAGSPGVMVKDVRTGKTGGAVTSVSSLYNFAYLTANGWKRCDSTPFQVTIGTPDRDIYCNVVSETGYSATPRSIAGQSMVSVVQQMQALPAGNTINNGVSTANLLATLGTAVFPAGSSIRERVSLSLSRPVFINSINTDGRSQAEATTLEQLIASKPVTGANLTNGAGTLNLGLSSGPLRALRAAISGTTSATAGTVQFYECDLNAAGTTISNCAASQTGTYSIDTVHGVRVLRFAGHAPTVMNHTRVFAEVSNAPEVITGNWVFQARENKPDETGAVSGSQRINATAWAAMKAQLGL